MPGLVDLLFRVPDFRPISARFQGLASWHEVDQADLITKAGMDLAPSQATPAAKKILGGEDLSGIFSLEMAQDAGAEAKPVKARAARKAAAKEGTTRKPKK